jgi:hypothetical protein
MKQSLISRDAWRKPESGTAIVDLKGWCEEEYFALIAWHPPNKVRYSIHMQGIHFNMKADGS